MTPYVRPVTGTGGLFLGVRSTVPYIADMRSMDTATAMRTRGPGRLRRGVGRVAVTFFVAGHSIACDNPAAVEVRQLRVEPEVALVLLGDTEIFSVEAFGSEGVTASAAGVQWSTADRSIATVGDDGLLRAVGEGETILVTQLSGTADTAVVKVYDPPDFGAFEPGVSYLGRRGYVEYIPGELPVILSAPHGGRLGPPEIPNRQGGTLVTDENTLQLTHAVRDALVDLTGLAPHLVLLHLERAKLDANREIVEAAEGNPFAERAWTEYHDFIRSARSEIARDGEGMHLDIHGHGHAIPRVELGYLLTRDDLNRSDASVSALRYVLRSSIREIGRDSPLPFAEVVRGAVSFGGLLEAEGIPAVPSPSSPMPGDDPYFTGGYSTREHGSLLDTELVSGIQLEHHFPGIRDTDANRRAYAAVLARVIRAYMLEHMGFFEPT